MDASVTQEDGKTLMVFAKYLELGGGRREKMRFRRIEVTPFCMLLERAKSYWGIMQPGVLSSLPFHQCQQQIFDLVLLLLALQHL